MRPGCGFVMLTAAAVGLALAPLAADDKEKKDSGKVEVKSATLAEIEKHVASQKGKPVAMDVWATWCVPCREKFPKFVALAGKHKGKASFLSLTIDEAEQLDEAKKFLEKSKATFANFLAKEGADAVQTKFGFEGVPQYVLWGVDGKIALKTDDVAKLEEKLQELLAAKKGDA
jgi:thiol-disulfide isomerase/thioredoxin